MPGHVECKQEGGGEPRREIVEPVDIPDEEGKETHLMMYTTESLDVEGDEAHHSTLAMKKWRMRGSKIEVARSGLHITREVRATLEELLGSEAMKRSYRPVPCASGKQGGKHILFDMRTNSSAPLPVSWTSF